MSLNRFHVSTLLLLLFFGKLVVGDELHDPKPMQRKTSTRATITISKETTFFTRPLTKDGYVDYRAALNAHSSKGVTPENNAMVEMLRAIGPNPEGAELPDEFFKRLGIKRLPKEGKYFVHLHKACRHRNASKWQKSSWPSLSTCPRTR